MLPTAPFGRTGHISTRTLFGAAALSQVTQADADRTLELLLGFGVNHIDTAASYGDAELRLAPWFAAHRERFFLATKTEKRTAPEALDELRQSLARMNVSHVDLWQLHNLVDPVEWDVAMGPGGALEAFQEARARGLVRFLGVTGHGVTAPAMHRRSLERFDFDAVLLPYNVSMMQNAAYARAFGSLLSLCRQRDVAVQTIKALARRPWGDKAPTRATWYEPFEDPVTIAQAVHWVLATPGLFINTVGDIDLLPQVLEAAAEFDGDAVERESLSTSLMQDELVPLFT